MSADISPHDIAAVATMPWLAEPLAHALARHRGHALLVHAAAGLGAQAYALALASGWLCEAPADDGGPTPCGRCASCRLVQARAHPDLMVVLPAALRRTTGWPLAGDKPDADDAKRKPSRQIRIDEVRAMIDWAHMTSARGRGKVAVLHPAEALNRQSANALLKTLEEPPPGTRLVLTCADPALLLPTVVSRCQLQRLPTPDAAAAVAWLQQHGGPADEAQARVLLAACSGRPLDALEALQTGVDAAAWAALPAAVARGHAAALAGWALPRAIDALFKICHDALVCAAGGRGVYFPALPPLAPAALPALADWSRELTRVARHDEHPWNEALLLDALVARGAQALQPPTAAPDGAGSDRLATLRR